MAAIFTETDRWPGLCCIVRKQRVHAVYSTLTTWFPVLAVNSSLLLNMAHKKQ